MRVKVIVCRFFLLMLIVSLTGCAGMSWTGKKTGETVNLFEKNETGMSKKKDSQDMKEIELQLLIDVFGDEQRLSRGQLYSYEKEALGQLRAGEEYLLDKYKENSFQLESFSPASKSRPWAELIFKYDRVLFRTKIIPSEDMTSYSCEDDFYSYLIREEYDAMIEQILAQAGCTVRSYTKFLSTIGNELDSDASIDELLEYKAKLSRDTHLFVEENGSEEETAAIIQNAIKKASIYGNYWIYYTDGNTEGDIRELEERKDEWESFSFCCFEID